MQSTRIAHFVKDLSLYLNVPYGRVRHTGKLDTFAKTTLKYLYYTNAFLELLVRRVKRSLDTAYTLSS